ncbi:acetyltransferase (GNAT) family protein [Maribacter vaceletii]|uniref:Acetyltransferase (GNAT) family protein n=1 Tax=Maribacter vaceletii TaxID=1206816 RepID=A0A495E6C4_9FLAO|nr:GNAT family N-acetyltransferase [Maribacter vaceletii]RKR12488.1 acetyltransferase (GNAT) family protein [Maribacter vaceletii]
MNSIKLNIENLISIWQTVSEPFNASFHEKEFDYCLMKDSEWPNRLWFHNDINETKIALAKEKLSSISTNLTVPYWNIHNNNSFQLLEENGFNLKFEQIGMSLKPDHSFIESSSLCLKKVSTKKETELWSVLFSKSFGYFINPMLLNKYQENTDYYIAYHKNEAVGTAILHITNKVTGIHSVGIIPEQRRKGYAEKIMKLLINQSIEINSDYITLQSSNMGKGLYLKLGFEEQFTIKNYALQQRI